MKVDLKQASAHMEVAWNEKTGYPTAIPAEMRNTPGIRVCWRVCVLVTDPPAATPTPTAPTTTPPAAGDRIKEIADKLLLNSWHGRIGCVRDTDVAGNAYKHFVLASGHQGSADRFRSEYGACLSVTDMEIIENTIDYVNSLPPHTVVVFDVGTFAKNGGKRILQYLEHGSHSKVRINMNGDISVGPTNVEYWEISEAAERWLYGQVTNPPADQPADEGNPSEQAKSSTYCLTAYADDYPDLAWRFDPVNGLKKGTC